MTQRDQSYWAMSWERFYRHKLGRYALYVVFLFVLVGIYAPFLASSKPLFVIYDGEMYFPLFRYLFYTGFFSKGLDIFFNIFIFTFPMLLLAIWLLKSKARTVAILSILAIHILTFFYFTFFPLKDPAADVKLTEVRQQRLRQNGLLSWSEDLALMTNYYKLNLVLRHLLQQRQHETLLKYAQGYAEAMKKTGHNQTLPTLWQVNQENEQQEINRLKEQLQTLDQSSKEYAEVASRLNYILDRRQWLSDQQSKIRFLVMPLLSQFHWEDDAGGQQALNHYLPWWHLTRINRKDLLAALIFGVRTSLTVGFTAVALALAIGIPIGALAGYYGGTYDIVVSRLLEIWEAMPVLFMLLLVVAILQSKSIFLITIVIGLFSWTTFSRYIRGEFFKQRNLPYVEACHALGFKDGYTMFKHILPNAIPPVLTLLPFAIMAAITSEAGLSFLGLGEEGSSSWGVLMDEGRSVFPNESYLLWPPAILLTILLVAIALVGDSLRDTLDPKLHK